MKKWGDVLAVLLPVLIDVNHVLGVTETPDPIGEGGIAVISYVPSALVKGEDRSPEQARGFYHFGVFKIVGPAKEVVSSGFEVSPPNVGCEGGNTVAFQRSQLSCEGLPVCYSAQWSHNAHFCVAKLLSVALFLILGGGKKDEGTG